MTIRSFLIKNIYLLVIAAWAITISFVVDNYWSANASLNTVVKEISADIQKKEKDFSKLVSNKETFDIIGSGNLTATYLQSLVRKDYFLFFYKSDSSGQQSLIAWNTQQVLPFPSILYEKKEKGFIKLQNGYYVWNRYNAHSIKAIALIPVKYDYIIENEYLLNDFVVDPSFTSNYEISMERGKGQAVHSVEGKPLFYVTERSAPAIYRNNIVAVTLQIIAAFLILVFVHLLASFIAANISRKKAILFLLVTILFLRILGYLFHFPLNFRQFELFDPAVYSSSPILRSLGDLLINAIFFTWFILFVRHQVNEKNIKFNLDVPYFKWIILGVGSIIIMLSGFVGSHIVRSLVADSKISFDVINFFTLNLYSVIGFVVLCCLAIGYYFMSQIINDMIKIYFPVYLPQFLFVCVAGLLILSFRIGNISGGFDIFVLLWILFFLFLLYNPVLILDAEKVVSSKLLFWLFFFSVSITSIIVVENKNKELRNRLHYAELIAAKADPDTEILINTMLTPFRDDFLANSFFRFADPNTNAFIKDSLVNENIAGYSNKYQTSVYSFGADEKPLFNSDSTSYNEINTILNTQAKPTGVPGLYYYDKSYDQYSYISKKTLRNSDDILVGYVFILASPKKQKSEALYPELFGKGNYFSIENSSLYAFALYNNGKLISSHNDYPFPSVIPVKKIVRQPVFVNNGRSSELWYYAGAGQMVIIVKENSLSIESITLFSYIFCSFLIMVSILWIINIFIKSRLNFKKFSTYWQLSIRNQIHGTIIFVSVVSFLVIGFATILFFISRFENGNREKLSRTIGIMQNELKNFISNGWNLQDTLGSQQMPREQRVEEIINRISEIHGVDVNLYDLKGNLRVSSLPLPYLKGIVSTKIHPLAYYHLHNLREVQFFQKENIGRLKFVSNYVPVKDMAGNDYAYLNIPYFTSQTNLRQEISNFLVTIINLNAFIFLLAGIVALFITNRITDSFSVIGDKMKKVNLGARNEAIEWKRDDELGELINEYNKMVSKLEESAQTLAKTEREGAWREMARQVAHEIKNPLTPMKLSMQFLQKAVESNAPNVKELTETVAGTLVAQIDHLSQIASEFSQFANIEDSKKELVDVNGVLRNVLHLYSANERLELTQKLIESPVILNADKTHINRLFTNLILNAIQAVPENETIKINISEKLADGKLLISIADNGQGIPEELRSKIFAPNFTTKTSGTGLGLAMCKRMVEQANGEIWFETKENFGTTFFLQFPVAD